MPSKVEEIHRELGAVVVISTIPVNLLIFGKLHAGELLLHAEELLFNAGELQLHAGELLLRAGELLLHAGELLLHAGELLLHGVYLLQVQGQYSLVINILTHNTLVKY